MKPEYTNITVKTLFVVFAVVFLWLFYQSSENKRYEFHRVNDESSLLYIFDSRTGIMYISSEEAALVEHGKWMTVDPRTPSFKIEQMK